MKRAFCMVLIMVLSFGLFGCRLGKRSDVLEPVEFYYPRKSERFVYGSDNGVISPEIREASGHVNDLKYLFSMYLYGPQDSELRSPFPPGCKLGGLRAEEDTLYIRLSEEFATLENIELTLACAALAKTCFSITDFSHICIDATTGEKTVSITLDESTLLFADDSTFDATAAAEQPQ